MPSPLQQPWTGLTRAYVGILTARMALYGVAVVANGHIQASSTADKVLGSIQVTLLSVGSIVGLLWLHQAWTRVPAASRRAYDGRRIEPNEAIWKLFLPLYGVYWMFLANIGLCGAIEAHQKARGARSTDAPSTLALIACLAQLVPLVNLAASPFLWAAFMTRVDAAQADVEARDPDYTPPARVGLLKALGIIVGALLLEWAVLVFVFLAIWQFLNPGARMGG